MEDQKEEIEKLTNKSKPGPKNLPWQKIGLEYVCDPTQSIRKLSQKYRVSKSTVAHIAARDGWIEQRAAFQKRASEETLELVKSVVAMERYKITITAQMLLEKGFNKIEEEEPKDGRQALQYIKLAVKIYRELLPVMIASQFDIKETDNEEDFVATLQQMVLEYEAKSPPDKEPSEQQEKG